MSDKSRVFRYLMSGATLTVAQAEARGISADSLQKSISRLRSKGYAVYSNKNASGDISYRLGTPSREMVALAYRRAGAALFEVRLVH
jgi:hypothetical protein